MAEPRQAAYFDTPERAERLQLVLHLVRNVGEVIYLRAPAGAGKTRFVQQLLQILGDDMSTVWLGAAAGPDLIAAVADQLGIAPDEALPWPDAVFEAIGGDELLVVADDADQLASTAVDQLAALHARGGQLLLIGQGGLAPATREREIRFVDLPAFDAAQSAAFLRAQADGGARRISDAKAADLHRRAQGLPGPLLDALGATARRPTRPGAVADGNYPGPGLLTWLAGGTVVLVLGTVLLLQSRINELFEPASAGGPRVAADAAAPPDAAPARAGADSRPALAGADAADAADAAPQTPRASPLPTLPADLAAKLPADAASAPAPTARFDERPAASPLPSAPNLADLIDQRETAAGPGTTEVDPLDQVVRDALAAVATMPAAAVADAEPPSREPEPTPAGGDLPVADTSVVGDGSMQAAGGDPGPPSAAAAGSSGAPVAPDGTPARGTAAAETVRIAAARADPVAAPVAAAGDRTGPTPAGRRAAPVDDRSRPAPAPQGSGHTAVPAPVEDRSSRPALAAVDSPPAARDAADAGLARASRPPAAAPAAAGGDADMAWLKARPSDHYTLQLIGARDREAVRRFARAHALPAQHAVFARSLDGRPWYSLVVGDYPDRGAAIAARERLAGRLRRSDIWPRTFGSIQKTLE